MTVRLLLAVVLLAAATAPALATNFTVLVGQDDSGAPALAYDPPSLSVQPGDTITFKNVGGLHNAHSIDPAFTFRCGNSSCTNASPNATLWTAPALIVPASAKGKTISYQCDQHGSAMLGQILVGALPVTLQSFDVK